MRLWNQLLGGERGPPEAAELGGAESPTATARRTMARLQVSGNLTMYRVEQTTNKENEPVHFRALKVLR
jgi:hypothetical protein